MEAQVCELRVLQLNNPVMCCSIVRDSTLSDQVTQGLSLLKVLVLSGQCLEQFPAFVTDLQQLKELDLSDNRIFAFPAEMAQLQRLQRLVLSGNRLTDKSFQNGDINWANLAALSELQLSHNQLTTLPKAFLALSGLQVLNVSNNLLRSLSASFAQLWEGKCKLVVLDLHHNVLTSLPEEIVVMKATLRCLLLHENNLTTLPSAMTHFQVLEELSLPNNALGSDFHVYPTTTAQTHIALEYNHLSVFPSLHNSVVKMYLEGTPLEIVSINVSWNRLRSIPPNALPTLLSSCLELHLQHNCLSELPEELFRALPQLQVCKLGINQLQKLPDSISSCQALQVLDVQQNRLQTLPSELGQMMNLVIMNATENQLSSVPSAWHSFATYTGITTGRRVLQTLGLRKNPIQNKVLKTIINGGNVDFATATIASTKSNDEQNCEFVLKKLIDALRDSLDVLAMETEGFNDDDDLEYNQIPTQKWKGMARNVNRYLEAKLASISNDPDPQKQHNSSYLHTSDQGVTLYLLGKGNDEPLAPISSENKRFFR
uniref:Uncharacterized protein n=1 Tax=Globisporangium ultimum (strain ATCC 200006 / CBS 805.95 / DAOM BR144) TaxID=431595 RepID=K3WWM4_GLOUD